ncbi:hypothetical protein VCHA53O466_40466 [Vibrio chagasii]|nr:hypothetical protein VCHA53O466_40466 [Vibrio chagasii]
MLNSNKFKFKRRTLKTIAKWVNTNLASHGYTVVLKEVSYTPESNTGRLRVVTGKTRTGLILNILKDGKEFYTFDSTCPYSYNDQVESKVRDICKSLKLRKMYFDSRAVRTVSGN